MAVVFNNGTITLYLNGIEVGTQAGSFSEVATHNNPAALGATNNDDLWQNDLSGFGNYFGGYLDDVQLFSDALSAAQV